MKIKIHRNTMIDRYENRRWKCGEVKKWTESHTLTYAFGAIFIILFVIFFTVLFIFIGNYIN